MANIKKIFIATVGTGRNREDIAKMLLITIKNSNPDLVYFLVSNRTNEETIPPFEEINQGRYKYETVILKDENDFLEVCDQTKELINELIKKFNLSQEDITVDYTSGTKAMSAGLILAAMQTGIEDVKYVEGERDEYGRVIAGGEDIRPSRTTLVLKEEEIKRIITLFNAKQFDAVIKLSAEIEDKIKVPRINNKAKLLNLLAQAYQNWDNFDHEQAIKKTDKIGKLRKEDKFFDDEIKKWKGLSTSLKVIDEHLHKCQKAKGKREYNHLSILLDIVASAQRRIEDHRYDDAAARLYRATEYIAQMRLSEKYEIDNTGKIPAKKVPESFANNHQYLLKNGHYKLSLVKSYELLNKFGDPLGKKFIEDFKPNDSDIKKHLKTRNESILAHGLRSLKQSEVENFKNWLLDFTQEGYDSFEESLSEIKFYQFHQ